MVLECDVYTWWLGRILTILHTAKNLAKANGIEVSVYRPLPAWVWNYRVNFSLFNWIIFIIGRFSTSGLSNILFTSFAQRTHYLIAKPSIRGQPHQRWSVAICSTSFGNYRNDDSRVRIAAWFLNHGFTLLCLLLGHWTSIQCFSRCQIFHTANSRQIAWHHEGDSHLIV